MKIGIFGTHSSGKTTLLNDLIKHDMFKNYKVFTGTTRSLKDVGVKINENGDGPGQEAIFEARLSNLDSDYFIADRTIADVLAYSTHLHRKGVLCAEILEKQRAVVAERMQEYDLVIYLTPDFDLVEDGVRSADVAYRDEISEIMAEIYEEFVYPCAHMHLRGTPEERLNSAIEVFEHFFEVEQVLPKILFHEAPICLMDMVDNSHPMMGSYYLVHMFEDHPEYLAKAVEYCADGNRMTILDNSMFELGAAFEGKRFVDWINATNPMLYIVPDVFQDADATIKALEDWNINHRPNVNGYGAMGVIQGKTFDELVDCYRRMEPHVDAIAIPFRSECFNHPEMGNDLQAPENLRYQASRRQQFIDYLFDSGIVNLDKVHHLLGCTYYKEFNWYRKPKYNWIASIDTSSPVMHGILDIPYDDLPRKPAAKMHTLMSESLEELSSKMYISPVELQQRVLYNIETFRQVCNENTHYAVY